MSAGREPIAKERRSGAPWLVLGATAALLALLALGLLATAGPAPSGPPSQGATADEAAVVAQPVSLLALPAGPIALAPERAPARTPGTDRLAAKRSIRAAVARPSAAPHVIEPALARAASDPRARPWRTPGTLRAGDPEHDPIAARRGPVASR